MGEMHFDFYDAGDPGQPEQIRHFEPEAKLPPPLPPDSPLHRDRTSGVAGTVIDKKVNPATPSEGNRPDGSAPTQATSDT